MYVAKSDKTQSSTPRVCIITINWNSYDYVARLLHHLSHLTYSSFDVMVVDNGSADDSFERLQKAYPAAIYRKLPENMGFGYANNVGIREAMDEGYAYSWLINNDAYPEPESLDRMIAFMLAFPKTGVVGAIVLDDDDAHQMQAWGGGHLYPWLGYAKSNRSANDPVEFITGACMLLRHDALRETGLFDERIFLYWEDFDLSLRLQKAGWSLGVAETRVYHKGSGTTRHFARTRSYHIMKHYSLLMAKHYKFGRLKSASATFFQSLGKCRRGHFPAAWGCWEGWWASFAANQLPDRTASERQP